MQVIRLHRLSTRLSTPSPPFFHLPRQKEILRKTLPILLLLTTMMMTRMATPTMTPARPTMQPKKNITLQKLPSFRHHRNSDRSPFTTYKPQLGDYRRYHMKVIPLMPTDDLPPTIVQDVLFWLKIPWQVTGAVVHYYELSWPCHVTCHLSKEILYTFKAVSTYKFRNDITFKIPRHLRQKIFLR